MLRFYWELGRDIVVLKAESRWGSGFMKQLSKDLKDLNSEATCFSQTNLLYMKNFYCLYQSYAEITPQVEEQLTKSNITPQFGAQSLDLNNTNSAPIVSQIMEIVFSIPWGHHKVLIDKCRERLDKALFYVIQTKENGWSRSVLLNNITSNLFERQGKALTNFTNTLHFT